MILDTSISNAYDFFIKIIQGLNIDKIISKIVSLVIIILIMVITVKISTRFVDKFIARQKKIKIALDEKRINTITTVLKSLLRYTIYFFGISAILYQFIGTISLTFASIGGVAIGLGTQNLIKDIVNGFFIVFEDQFSVGDYINIGDKGGIVESIGLRLTKLKDFNGDIHVIPNGSIAQITNHSRASMRVLVEVDVAYEEDVDRVTEVLQGVCEKFRDNEDIVEGPKVLGVSALKDSGVTFTLWATAKSMTQWECERNLRREVKKALDREGIEIPYPKRAIYHINENSEDKNFDN